MQVPGGSIHGDEGEKPSGDVLGNVDGAEGTGIGVQGDKEQQ